MHFIQLKNKKGFFVKKKNKVIKNTIYIKYFIILIIIFLISFLSFKILFISKKKKHIIIEVDISKSFYDGGGPVQLSKSLRDVLPYETEKCLFIPSRTITPIMGKIDLIIFICLIHVYLNLFMMNGIK